MKELAKSNPQDFDVQATAYSQSISMEVMGEIAPRQAFDAATGEFQPDYSLRPCQVFPRCYLIDPDSPVATGLFNSQLTSFQWFEITPTGERVIYPTSEQGGVLDGYKVDKDGTYKGMLYVNNNGKVGNNRTVHFIGLWRDPVSKYLYRFDATKPLVIEDATFARPEVALDSPVSCPWNPLRQTNVQTITATVIVGKKVVTDDSKCKIWWVRVLNDGTRENITSNDAGSSFEITNIVTGGNGQIQSITIDKNLIGDGISYEVYAAYSAEGSLPLSYRNTDAKAVTSITRAIPNLTASFMGTTTRVASGVTQVCCKAIVSDGRGTIPEDTWKDLIKCKWESVVRTLSSSGTVNESATLIGYGNSQWVSVTQYKFVRLTLLDRGNFVAIVDDSDDYLTDDDGNILIERELLD